MGSYVDFVQGPAYVMEGVSQAAGIIDYPPEGTFKILIAAQGITLPSAGSWGLRLGCEEGIDVSGYRAGHSKFKDNIANSISESGSWFVLCGHETSANEFYGPIRLERFHTGLNRWVCDSNLSDFSGGRIARFSSGTNSLSSPLTCVHLYGNGSGNFTGGSFTFSYLVKKESLVLG